MADATFDAASSGQTAGAVLSMPHTVSAGANPIITSEVLIWAGGGATVLHAKYNGVAMFKKMDVSLGGNIHLYKFELVAPAQGSSYNVIITATAGGYMSAINVSALGVNQAAPTGAGVSTSGSGTSSAETAPGVVAGDLVLDNHVIINASPTAGADQTERGRETSPSGWRHTVSTQAGADGGLMTWSWGGVWTYGAVALALKAVAVAAPAIDLSIAAMAFSAGEAGANPDDQTFDITNDGEPTSELNWTANDDMAWLTTVPGSGGPLAQGASETVTVSIDISGLAVGTHTGTITISDPAASNTPQTIAITLTVYRRPEQTVTLKRRKTGTARFAIRDSS